MQNALFVFLSTSTSTSTLLFLLPKTQKNKKKQVDRTNFQEGLAALRQALAVGDFYALDCEFTGIDSSNNRPRNLPPFRPPSDDATAPPTPIDDPEERYPALASAASRFAVAQVGIAVFEWVKGGSGGSARGSYRAHTFNCWTFVSDPESTSASAFQCTTGSLSFLSGAGFDFNRWIGKGIPSCSARERDELLKREEARKGGNVGVGGGGAAAAETNGQQQQPRPQPTEFQRPPIVPTIPYDISLVHETFSRVSEWLSNESGEGGGGEGGEILRLKGGNAFQRALVYQTLEKGPGLAALRFHPGTDGDGEKDARFVAKTLWPDEEEAFFAEVAAERQEPPPSLPAAPAAPSSLPPQRQQQRPRRADIVLRRVPPGGAKLAAERERQQRLERARLGSGFALFLEALRDSKLLCAVHNGANDLAHVVASFGDGLPLPASLAGFSESVERWFPGGVFDTKVLASGAFLRGGPFWERDGASGSLRGARRRGEDGGEGRDGGSSAADAAVAPAAGAAPFASGLGPFFSVRGSPALGRALDRWARARGRLRCLADGRGAVGPGERVRCQ